MRNDLYDNICMRNDNFIHKKIKFKNEHVNAKLQKISTVIAFTGDTVNRNRNDCSIYMYV